MDLNRTAFRIVETLTAEDKSKPNKRSESAKRAGKLGGAARAKILQPEKLRSIALKANRARWEN